MRREKSAILVFGLGFTLLVVAAVIFIDPSFFYSRLETDALLYYLNGKTFAETGSTAARLAINLAPFPYASMPGVLRAPLIGAFSDFNDQLRAIQLSNIVILDAIALMSAYMFSWVLPASRHWIAIGFAFGFTLLSPWWMANIFITLADAPYAACSLASMLIAIRTLASPRPLATRPVALAAFVIFFALLAISLVVGIRSRQSARGAPERATKLTAIMSEYIAGMTDTYRPLKRYLMTLPRKRAILSVGARSGGRWKAIANLDYYAFDSGLVGGHAAEMFTRLSSATRSINAPTSIGWRPS